MELPAQEKFDQTQRGEIFDLLSNHRRRFTIQYCKDNGSATLGELAEHIAAFEQEKDISQITAAERKRVYTSLQQTHLKRLAEAGMIDWDGDTVELTDQTRELEVYLDVVPEGSISWGWYYFGLSALAGLVVAGVWVGFLPSSTFSLQLLLTGFALIFTGSAVVHILYNRGHRLDRLSDT